MITLADKEEVGGGVWEMLAVADKGEKGGLGPSFLADTLVSCDTIRHPLTPSAISGHHLPLHIL